MNYVPAVSKEHLGYLFDVDVQAHARRRYRALPSPDLRTSRIGVEGRQQPVSRLQLCPARGPPPPQGRRWPEGDETSRAVLTARASVPRGRRPFFLLQLDLACRGLSEVASRTSGTSPIAG
jgi:hypothetical protein